MFTIRIDLESKEMIAFLRNHKVRFTHKLKKVIKAELSEFCREFKMKEKRIKDAPDWLYD